ncbi:MAG TPA: hypothetical protein VGA48_10080 [Thermoplasmata archaeon]
MLYLQSGNIKEGRQKEYQAWVKENEGAIQKHAPKGWIYRGTFGTVFGFGRFDTTTMWEISKYSDLDASREHTDETFERLNEEWTDFFISGAGEANLIREVGDVRIIEPKKPKK